MASLGKYTWLIELLQKSDGMTFEDISKEWLKYRRHTEDENVQILERTFHNHIKAIREEYGIHIKCGADHKYYIADPYKEVLPKIGHLSVLNLLNMSVSENKINKSIFIEDNLMIFRDSKVMTIMKAIETKRKVQLKYLSPPLPQMEECLALTVAPYQLHYMSSFWYLVGQTDEFGLMRIPLLFCGDAYILEESYTNPTDFDEGDSEIVYGKTKERIQVPIFINERIPELLELYKYPLLPFQREVEFGCWTEEGCSYNAKITFDLPKTPFALGMLKYSIPGKYGPWFDQYPFTIFSEEQYGNEMSHPVIL